MFLRQSEEFSFALMFFLVVGYRGGGLVNDCFRLLFWPEDFAA